MKANLWSGVTAAVLIASLGLSSTATATEASQDSINNSTYSENSVNSENFDESVVDAELSNATTQPPRLALEPQLPESQFLDSHLADSPSSDLQALDLQDLEQSNDPLKSAESTTSPTSVMLAASLESPAETSETSGDMLLGSRHLEDLDTATSVPSLPGFAPTSSDVAPAIELPTQTASPSVPEAPLFVRNNYHAYVNTPDSSRPEPPREEVVYREEGEASWYGPGFNGNPTASGEVFDQYAVTAAHPSLPFGTMVRVTNQDNGRSTMVRINDRGPFAGHRVLDLSYGAASELGVVDSGTAYVSIEILEAVDPAAYIQAKFSNLENPAPAETAAPTVNNPAPRIARTPAETAITDPVNAVEVMVIPAATRSE